MRLSPNIVRFPNPLLAQSWWSHNYWNTPCDLWIVPEEKSEIDIFVLTFLLQEVSHKMQIDYEGDGGEVYKQEAWSYKLLQCCLSLSKTAATVAENLPVRANSPLKLPPNIASSCKWVALSQFHMCSLHRMWKQAHNRNFPVRKPGWWDLKNWQTWEKLGWDLLLASTVRYCCLVCSCVELPVSGTVVKPAFKTYFITMFFHCCCFGDSQHVRASLPVAPCRAAHACNFQRVGEIWGSWSSGSRRSFVHFDQLVICSGTMWDMELKY